jgi:hypothetical protein
MATQITNELNIDKESIVDLLLLISKNEDSIAQEAKINEEDEKLKIEKLSTVWDLSASKDVARYLFECHVVDVLVQLLQNEHAHTYRLFEVAVGTLANLCSTSEQIALSMAKVFLTSKYTYITEHRFS